MRRITDILRDRLHLQAGLSETEANGTPAAIARDIREKMECADHCNQLAKDRLQMGTYRYGVSMHDRYDYRARLTDKLARYDATGNKEFLIDIINYCILEFFWPRRTDTYFKVAEDDEGSKRSYDF